MTTAAALIIGDEILGGTIADKNGPWLIAWLRGRGLDLRYLGYLPDDPSVIATEVARLAPRHDWIFTSGGVGPTHDDVTFAALARGLGRNIERHPAIVEVLERRVGDDLTPGALRMADVPTEAELWWDGEIEYPVVVVANVVVLPGLPTLFQRKLEAVAHRFHGQRPRRRWLHTSQHESQFSIQLGELVERHPTVKIGSYPRTEPSLPWRVQLILDSLDAQALERCEAELRVLLGDSVVKGEDPLGEA